MDWLDKMNAALNYLEAHLDGVVDYEALAQKACCSSYHFQRMFSFISGVPLSEYIRRRRLTLAAFALQNSDIKVIDLALKYGYESPEAFSRAFSRMHGTTPMSARSRGVMLKAYPRLSFQISIKGECELDYRIEEKEAFEVFGLELQTNVIDGICYKEIPAFWEACEGNGSCLRLAGAAKKEPQELLDVGVTYGHSPNGDMRYMIGCLKEPGMQTEGFCQLQIPAQTWAVFSVDWQGPESDSNLHEVWQRIYSDWFPTADYEHADCDFDMEMYFGHTPSEYGVAIWIPVTKKR